MNVAEPTLSLARKFASITILTPPESWVHEAGWTKYYPDGSFEHVDNLADETLICFDVETMPPHHQYAVMACAATPDAWYSWLSPWLLGIDDSPEHLVPIGDPSRDRVIVGHNVSYDRARILEEYHVKRTKSRFLDTMALHVSVKGISSHQRPSWMTRRKAREENKNIRVETIDAVKNMLHDAEARMQKEMDAHNRERLKREVAEMEDSLPHLNNLEDVDDEDMTRWEDITSVNSLAEVARLHCGIEISKAPRNDFMKSPPDVIRADLDAYLSYCAQDVGVTHRVYTKVLPLFLEACPSPVTFAGVATMGNSFLPVNHAWDEYIARAEETYRSSEISVLAALHNLARKACGLFENGEWRNDPWLSQLDWTPKTATVNRIPYVETEDCDVDVQSSSEGDYYDTAAIAEDIETTPIENRYGPRRDGCYALPAWYHRLAGSPSLVDNPGSALPHILQITYDGYPVFWSSQDGWVYRVPNVPHPDIVASDSEKFNWQRIPFPNSNVSRRFFHKSLNIRIYSGQIKAHGISKRILLELSEPSGLVVHQDLVLKAARRLLGRTSVASKFLHINNATCEASRLHERYSQLDWTPLVFDKPPKHTHEPARRIPPLVDVPQSKAIIWPKWYFDLTAPKSGKAPGSLDLTPRSRAAALLLKLSWRGWPLFHSRAHGWVFRVDKDAVASFQTRQTKVEFTRDEDEALRAYVEGGYVFYKLPHKDGEKANVGSPLTKTFVQYASDGTLSSPNDAATKALKLNAECSYWISARDRIMNQMVVRSKEGIVDIGVAASVPEKWGLILPQVVTMGTVTRRAIEKTWMTASNAKKNRVGSELKAMVRAPPGYVIVGADVDSEELWISSVMGDAQFGLHGASAIGWMTLEGTKAAGTDLHSKTAKILGISRDQAKVFNYSRIYGAGMRHAELLLLQSNPNMAPEQARQLAENLYASTKGKNTRRKDLFSGKFWYGGTESFVFNKLEEIALSDAPQTPALGCGVTEALSREYLQPGFGTDFMPSRINWVVQSSGVDYLHLLIVAMEHLISTYDIDARYLISVHDELRYLVREEDKYRLAMALQIANLWTRSQFAFRLGFDDLPQGVAFFSAIDIDHVLRKEVDMPCVTPSHPTPIPPGESLDIRQILQMIPGGSLRRDLAPMHTADDMNAEYVSIPDGYRPHDNLVHRAREAAFLQAQSTKELAEIKSLSLRVKRKQKETSAVQ
jgi:DNA polymerase gamma 1